jgi:hypothetical protein
MNFYEDRSPPNRRLKGCGGTERVMTEGAVSMALALYLFEQGAATVAVHPDGEHGMRFEFKRFLESRGFKLINPIGSTDYGGTYSRGEQKLFLQPKSGLGDVVAVIGEQTVFCECKGGVINTKHSGQVSILKKRLCEGIGQLMCRPIKDERHIVAVPRAKCTSELAQRMYARVQEAGIEIALVKEDGFVSFVGLQSMAAGSNQSLS